MNSLTGFGVLARRPWPLALCLMLAACAAIVPRAFADESISDGPYLLYRGDPGKTAETRVILGLRGDSLLEHALEPQVMDGGTGWEEPYPQFSFDGESFPQITQVYRQSSRNPASRRVFESAVTVDSATRLLAISDIHGDFDRLAAFLRTAGVVDSSLHWSWGDGRLVVPGDIFDRGAQVTECLWFLCRLQFEAWFRGGRVHVLLGNHELMVMRGDLRYVNEKYTEGIVKRTGIAYDKLYGPDSELGRWLRSLNTVMRINDMLFVHGGIAPWLAESGLTLGQINDSARAAIDMAKDSLAERPFLRRLFGTDGPFWYRGYHYEMEGKYPAATAADVDAVLGHFGAAMCVVGHTEVDSLGTLFDGRVVAVDVPVEELGGFEGLLWEGGEFFRLAPDGRRVPLDVRTPATTIKTDY